MAEFSATGTLHSVVRELAAKLHPNPFSPYVLVGLLKTRRPDREMTLTSEPTTLGALLSRLCSEEDRCSFSVHDHIVVVLPKDANEAGLQLLRLRLSHFDMVVDDWPDNLFMRLPEFSPEVTAFLQRIWLREVKLTPPRGSPGVTMTTDRRPPHTEIHLRNCTVMQVLNAISERSEALAQERDPEGRTLSGPMGWQCEIPPVGELPFEVWSRRVFSAFP